MHPTNEKLLKMVKDGKTSNEICEALAISNKQLYQRITWLRNIGVELKRSYYENGNISYYFKKPLYDSKDMYERVYTNPSLNGSQIVKTIVVSDLHLGNIDNSRNYMDNVYNFCVKNGIHIILNSGDLFEGILSSSRKLIRENSAIEQITNGLKEYPFDKSIINFITLGNHDYSFSSEYGTDLKTIINDRRHDLVALGYGIGQVFINDLNIQLFHPLGIPKELKYDFKDGIVIRGHGHKFKLSSPSRCLYFHAPSLSDITPNMEDSYLKPSFLQMDIKFSNYKPEETIIAQYTIIDNKIYKTGQFNISLRNIDCYEKNYDKSFYKYTEEENPTIIKNQKPFTRQDQTVIVQNLNPITRQEQPIT